MPNVTWLLDAARGTGLPVVEVAGWQTRGHGQFSAGHPSVVVGHHTGTPETAAGDYPSLRIVRDGRSDLPGPLCNYGLGRSGTVYVVAAGVAWHAGASEFAGLTDLNNKSIGIEAESAGDGRWTAAQLDAYPRLVAAALRGMGRSADRYVSHRTAATHPRGRKPDPKGIEDAWMRQRATAILTGTHPPIPNVTWIPEDSMVPVLKEGDGQRGGGDRGRLHWWVGSAQALINIRGLSRQVAVDGVFGPETTAMIRELQNRSNVSADGMINAATWPWLLGNDAPDFA